VIRGTDDARREAWGFQRTIHCLLSVLKLFGVDMLEQNEWERDSLLIGDNGADGITWVLTRPVRPTLWRVNQGENARQSR
jgi:hypothetical protein